MVFHIGRRQRAWFGYIVFRDDVTKCCHVVKKKFRISSIFFSFAQKNMSNMSVFLKI